VLWELQRKRFEENRGNRKLCHLNPFEFLTIRVVGQFAQAIVAKKVDHNSFVIRTSRPNVEVSWQVTGIRQDAYANAHRIEAEEDKPKQEQGHYLHPELFDAPPEQAVGYQAPSTPTHAETARVSTSTSPSSPLK
jgi:hypothetical protein